MEPDERKAFDIVNASRVARGLRRLRRGYLLHRWARHRAEIMAREHVLEHGDTSAFLARHGRAWSYWGENIGVGPAGAIVGIHKAFMASPPHKANVLGGRYRRLGIGVVTRNGVTWESQVFLR